MYIYIYTHKYFLIIYTFLILNYFHSLFLLIEFDFQNAFFYRFFSRNQKQIRILAYLRVWQSCGIYSSAHRLTRRKREREAKRANSRRSQWWRTQCVARAIIVMKLCSLSIPSKLLLLSGFALRANLYSSSNVSINRYIGFMRRNLLVFFCRESTSWRENLLHSRRKIASALRCVSSTRSNSGCLTYIVCDEWARGKGRRINIMVRERPDWK